MAAGWKAVYKATPVAQMGVAGANKAQIERGDKLVLPASALDALSRLDLAYPMVFEVMNMFTGQLTHCGVYEFSAPPGQTYVPAWLMDNLSLEPAGAVQVRSITTLPKGTSVQLRPHKAKFAELPNPSSVILKSLRDSFSCLTKGDTLPIRHENTTYLCDVVDVQPAAAVTLYEAKLRIEFTGEAKDSKSAAAKPPTPPASPAPSAAAGASERDVKTGPSTPPAAAAGAASATPTAAGATTPTAAAAAGSELTPEQAIEAKHSSELAELVAMGVDKPDAINALVICGANKDVISRVTEYLFATPARREAIRAAEMQKKLSKAEDAHKAEVSRLTAAFTAKKHVLQVDAYTAFVRALIADGHVGDAELKKLEVCRSQSEVTESEHRAVLLSLGVSGGSNGAAWQRMVAEGVARRDKLDVSSDCAHCHNAKQQLPTDHLVLDCMHLCLCETCAPLYQVAGAVCPKCARPAKKVVKTFR